MKSLEDWLELLQSDSENAELTAIMAMVDDIIAEPDYTEQCQIASVFFGAVRIHQLGKSWP
jgi:hypothetical protein